MSIKNLWKGNRAWLFIGLLFLIVLPLAFNSCGSEYEAPSTTQTSNALISAATLQSWIDAGLVNGSGYDKVVILHVGSSTSYFTTGHIPGSLYIDSSEISQSRLEGIAVSNYEVLEGAKMDALIRKMGIDGNTTIVFTGSSLLYPCRAYFTFRYWGFPKNRLKVLDGVNVTWATTYTTAPYALVTSAAPTVTQSTYSVTDNGVLRDDLRISLPEMIAYAEGNVPNALAIDTRDITPGFVWSYGGLRGSTGSNYSPSNDYTVFEGRIRGARELDYTTLYNGTTYIVDPVSDLTTSFNTAGLDSTKTAYIYCRFGFQGSVAFFILDGILGWPVAFYDGSWAQWGQLSGNSTNKGQLNASSPWQTDIATRSELIVYNYNPGPAYTIGAVVFYGTGLNDMTAGGTFTANVDKKFRIQIDSVGGTDTFKWQSSAGSTTWNGSAVGITGVSQTLSDGITITFGATTGHTLSDYWDFAVPDNRKPVEQLTADGSTCSARYNLDGTITNSINNGAYACTSTPTSFDVDVNKIEQADKAYMGSGGGSGGGGGGGEHGGC